MLKMGGKLEEHYKSLCQGHGAACPRCDNPKHYPLKDGRRRCAGCGYTHHLFSGRFLLRPRLALEAWQLLVRLFVDGVTNQEAAKELGLSHATAHKAYTTIRLAALAGYATAGDIFCENGELVDFCPNLEREDEEALCGGCESYVFGLSLPVDGPARLEVAPGLKAREVLASPLAKKRWRNFIHTDRYNGFDALVFSCCKRGRDFFAASFTQESTRLDEQASFKAHADGWLARYRAFKPTAYPLYLAEAVMRYSRPEEALIAEIENRICGFVPKRRKKYFSSVQP